MKSSPVDVNHPPPIIHANPSCPSRGIEFFTRISSIIENFLIRPIPHHPPTFSTTKEPSQIDGSLVI